MMYVLPLADAAGVPAMEAVRGRGGRRGGHRGRCVVDLGQAAAGDCEVVRVEVPGGGVRREARGDFGGGEEDATRLRAGGRVVPDDAVIGEGVECAAVHRH
jgi:hypothetical protein